MVMPVLAVAAQDFADYSVMWVGIAIGGYGLTQAMLQIPMGMLSDKWGRKPVILLGLSVFALGSIVAAYADSMLWLTCGRILQGAGAIAGAIMALATDVSREQHRAKVMAIIGIAIGFSFYLAVILGPAIANVWGMAGVFGVTGVLAILCLPLVKWVVPECPKQSTGETLPRLEHVVKLFVSPALWRLNVSVLLLHMLITLLFVQLPTSLLNVDIPLSEHWFFYAPVLLVSVVFLALLMRGTKGKTPRGVVFACLLMIGAAFAALPFAVNSSWFMVVALVVFFTGFNYLEANFPAILSTLAPVGQKGTAMGIYASFQFFGAFLGGILSGFLAQQFGANAAYVAGVLIVLLWFTIVWGLRSERKLKRITLSVPQGIVPTAVQLDSLASQQGVVESAFAAEQQLVFLKVDSAFDEANTRSQVNDW